MRIDYKSGVIVVAMLFVMMLIAPLRSRADESATLFNESCGSCHGQDGSANTPGGKKLHAANLRSKPVQSQSDQQLYDSIATGKQHKNYPHAFLYKGMTEKQIRGLVAHIRSFK